jgi:hypothetical protein
VGPAVRVRLPPAVSLQTLGPAPAGGRHLSPGLSPAEHASLTWTHLRTKNCQQTKNNHLTGKAPYRSNPFPSSGESANLRSHARNRCGADWPVVSRLASTIVFFTPSAPMPRSPADPAGRRILGNIRAAPRVEHASLCSRAMDHGGARKSTASRSRRARPRCPVGSIYRS